MHNRNMQDIVDALHEAGYRQIQYSPKCGGLDLVDSGMYQKAADEDLVCARINYSEDHVDPHIVMHKFGVAHIQKYVMVNRDWDLVGEILKLERILLS